MPNRARRSDRNWITGLPDGEARLDWARVISAPVLSGGTKTVHREASLRAAFSCVGSSLGLCAEATIPTMPTDMVAPIKTKPIFFEVLISVIGVRFYVHPPLASARPRPENGR